MTVVMKANPASLICAFVAVDHKCAVPSMVPDVPTNKYVYPNCELRKYLILGILY